MDKHIKINDQTVGKDIPDTVDSDMNIDELNKEISHYIWNDFKDGISHGVLVSNLAYHLGKKMKLTEAECYDLALAGFLHDIGKLELSKYLYGRNNKGLSIEEMKYMRMHSKLSYDLLMEYHYSDNLMETVLRHHECYDGSGYPDNLKGEEIPLGARILRVIDEFAALISDRPYRKAFDIETAVDIMIEEVKNMDMGVFITFQKMIHEPETIQLIKDSKIEINDIDLED